MSLLRPRLMFIVVPVLVLLIAGAVFLLAAKPLFGIDLGLSLIKRERTAVSVSVLTEVRDIMSLNTIEYVYKSVFPHDFIPEDMRWDPLIYRAAREEPLTPEEAEYASIYYLCKEIGIDLRRNNYEFVIVTSIIKAGYDFTDTTYEHIEEYTTTERSDRPDSKYPELGEYIRISEDGSRLFLKLPDPEIISFIIEDSTTESYAYPDITISPEQWRILSSFVTEKVRAEVLNEGILRLAQEKGEAFISKIMRDAGFEEVVFVE